MLSDVYQHPPTFASTGDLRRDFSHAHATYDLNVRSLMPLATDRPILEIGCGWGQFLSWVRARGYTAAVGIDVGSAQVAFCRDQGLDATEVADSAAYLQERPNQFELIALHHVIEHMLPSAGLSLLQAARGSLRPGGRILVQTPNMSATSASFSRYIEISHATGYTETSLAQLLELAGFKDVRIYGSRIPLSLRPKRLAFLAMHIVMRAIWRALLLSELGTDTPRILAKNLFGTAVRTPATPGSIPGSSIKRAS